MRETPYLERVKTRGGRADAGGGLIISITPEIALDQGYTYAGGLGVLEGDKFYSAGRLGLNYTVLTLLYEHGYVSYEFDHDDTPRPKPQPQPPEFTQALSVIDRFSTSIQGEEVVVESLEYRYGTAGAVFFHVKSPGWARKAVERLYIEDSVEEKFYKYTILAKASAEFMKRNTRVEDATYIDLQEAYTALLPLLLKSPSYRFIIHTAGPWGHPSFPRNFFASEYKYAFIEPEVYLTNIGLATARKAFAVSAKHYEILLKVFPHFSNKLCYVTNGVDIERWALSEVKEFYRGAPISLDRFIEVREKIKGKFEEFLRQYKKSITLEGKFVVVWARRLTRYKRPWMALRLAEDLRDLPIVFVLAGKAHPQDNLGIHYMKLFRKLHTKAPNVVYVHDYDILKAKVILSSGDLLLFTPFSGLEACGTSFMKAAVNGVPTLASRDGGVPELVESEVSGWLFGEDLREIVENNAIEESINDRDYAELKARILQIHDLYRRNPEDYYKVALSALRSLVPRVSMLRVLKEYYTDLLA